MAAPGGIFAPDSALTAPNWEHLFPPPWSWAVAMATSLMPWVHTLRRALKAEHGHGWSVREQSGKVQLTRRFEDGTLSSVVLKIAWNAGCISRVIERVSTIRERMEAQKLTLANAHELHYGAPVESVARVLIG